MGARLLKAISFFILAYSLVTLPAIIFGEDHYPRIGRLHGQLERIRHENRKLDWRIRELKKEVYDLRSDPTLIKRVARQELGYVGEDEVVFIVD